MRVFLGLHGMARAVLWAPRMNRTSLACALSSLLFATSLLAGCGPLSDQCGGDPGHHYEESAPSGPLRPLLIVRGEDRWVALGKRGSSPFAAWSTDDSQGKWGSEQIQISWG